MPDVPIPEDIKLAAYKVVERGYNEGLLEAVERAIMAERERSLLECEELCRKAASYYESGAGSSHSPAARHVAKMQAIWLAEEIAAIRRGTP